MNKNNFIYDNELKQLGEEFKNLKKINSNEINLNEINSNNSDPGLKVSHLNTNSVQELMDRFKKYSEKKKIILGILTPCYGGLCYSNYTLCLINTIKIFESCNCEVMPYFLNNDSLVSRARNNLIGCAMLNESISHLIFIDSDIIWNPFDIIKLILSDEMIIGGLYPKKKYNFDKVVANIPQIPKWIDKKNQINQNISNDVLIKNNLLDYNLNYVSKNLEIKNNVIEVRHLATGFMMIKREAILLMMEKFPETKYTDDTGFLSVQNSIYTYALFDCGVMNQNYYSEDWLFCHRWISIGGKIYANISIDLTHIGTENYQGSFITKLLTGGIN